MGVLATVILGAGCWILQGVRDDPWDFVDEGGYNRSAPQELRQLGGSDDAQLSMELSDDHELRKVV